MDHDKELSEANRRIAKLEQELAEWQTAAIETMEPEKLAENVLKQQVETLTFHLLKSAQDLENKNRSLSKARSDLTESKKQLDYMQQQLETRQQIIEKLKQLIQLKEQAIASPKSFAPVSMNIPDGMRAGVAQLAPETDVKRAIDFSRHTHPTARRKKNIHDFINLIKHVERIKIKDAEMLMDTDKKTILAWAEKLEERQYVLIEGFSDDSKMIVASRKLIRSK